SVYRPGCNKRRQTLLSRDVSLTSPEHWWCREAKTRLAGSNSCTDRGAFSLTVEIDLNPRRESRDPRSCSRLHRDNGHAPARPPSRESEQYLRPVPYRSESHR